MSNRNENNVTYTLGILYFHAVEVDCMQTVCLLELQHCMNEKLWFKRKPKYVEQWKERKKEN